MNLFIPVILEDTIPCHSKSFMGHFIMVIGFDNEKELIFYRNSSCNEILSYTGFSSFEIARKSYGTDQDILFIYT